MSLYITPDKPFQKSRKTPQHSTPIKSKHASPSASLSPVKHDISSNYAALQSWDSPSILRAGCPIHSSPTNFTHVDVNSGSVKNHDIYQRLLQNGDQRGKDNLSRQKPLKMRLSVDKERNTHVFGEGDSPRSDGPKISMTERSDRTSNRELSPLETSTMQKQRAELELMITELRDRDRELNEMVSSHHKQLESWEMDRSKLLKFSQKCASLQAELDKKTDRYHGVCVKLMTLKAELKQKDLALENTKSQLSGVSETHSKSVLKTQDLQDMNSTLSESVKEMSTTLGELQAKEEQLKTLIQHKDSELVNASSQITDMIKKLKKLDDQYKDLRRKEIKGQKDVIEWKEKYAESRKEVEHLKGDLNRSNQYDEESKTEMIKYKQQIEVLKQQLMLAGERERRKDDLLALQKSKQERTDGELTHLRQLYEREQRELSLLHLNLEKTTQLLAQQRSSSLAHSSSVENGENGSSFVSLDVTSQSASSTRESRITITPSMEPMIKWQYGGDSFAPLQSDSSAPSKPSSDAENAHQDRVRKSAQQVGELFDDSLHHALKINSISAGLKSKYFKPCENAKESVKNVQLVASSCQITSDSGSMANEVSDEANSNEQSDATDPCARFSKSQAIVEPDGEKIKVIESEPCLGNTAEASQNHNVNSHASEGVASNASGSNQSFYATPSSSDHSRHMNETYQLHKVEPQTSLHKVAQQDSGAVVGGEFVFCPEVSADSEISANGVPIIVQEPLFSVKMSMDSGLNSSVSSTGNSCRMTPTPIILKCNEIQPSPCSTLERLLAESRIMVEQLDMNNAGALSTGSISSSDA